jgi:NAD(P)-dependent dehydrogenase (short-subunit alcohol dehydrogenase family)
MGRSIALTLAREGAKVVVNYRSSQESALAICSHINAAGGSAIAVQADVFTAEGCAALVKTTHDQFGRVDICIINPGAGWHPEPLEQLDSAGSLEDIQHETAPILNMLPLLLPGMYGRQWGRIIGIAMHPGKLSPAYAYNLGKAARMQALLLASEAAWKHSITLNVIAPGPVAGLPSLDEAISFSRLEAGWQSRSNITPQDIAEGVLFLCSEAGRFVTGCVLPYVF